MQPVIQSSANSTARWKMDKILALQIEIALKEAKVKMLDVVIQSNKEVIEIIQQLKSLINTNTKNGNSN